MSDAGDDDPLDDPFEDDSLADDSLIRAIAFTPAVASDEEPTQLKQFRIVKKLGQGGMGIVYHAHDETLHRDVALKLMRAGVADDPRRRARFQREARSAAAVTHANIATVYEVGEAEGRLYIAMELVEGMTLRSRLASGALPVAEAVRIARKIARGLARAHERGIVHRDLKPDNVMIDRDGEAKILDFGLAKLRGPESESEPDRESKVPSTQAGMVLGTPGYMAPEQMFGQKVDARADVFAFGVCLFEMLTGVRPPADDDVKVPPPYDAIVEKCLDWSLDKRYANAKDVLAALDETQSQSQSQSPSQSQSKVVASISVTPPAAPPSSSAETRPSGTRRLTFMGALGVLALGTIIAISRGPDAQNGSTDASVPAEAGAAMTDPSKLPLSKNPDAVAAYADGLKLVRDASRPAAADAFRRATTLDPQLAAAHLRAVLYSGPGMTLGAQREHFAAAREGRDRLDERDKLFLGIAELLVDDAPKADDIVARARAVAERFPRDAEALMYVSMMLVYVQRAENARSWADRALVLDPGFAYAELLLGESYKLTGDDDPALQHYARCVELSPTAGSCIRRRADISMARGDCNEAFADAKRMQVVEPKSYRTYEYTALALAGRGAPIDGVREALAKRTAMQPEDRRPLAAAMASTWTSILDGDLVSAETAARDWESKLAGSLVESDHGRAMHHLLDVLEERGDVAAALVAADAYEGRSSAWTLDDPLGVRMRIAILRRHAHKIDDATFEKRRAALVDEAKRARPDITEVWRWYLSRATFLETKEEAKDALAAMPASGPPNEAKGLWQDNIGRMYFLAGDAKKAVPYLRGASSSCSVMSSEDSPAATTVWYLRAQVFLGRALAETGDKDGACKAFAVVRDRWKTVKPRSLTLDDAVERSKKLGCP